jgi:Cu(I)/Ag(I) efflux system membrane fusion protein
MKPWMMMVLRVLAVVCAFGLGLWMAGDAPEPASVEASVWTCAMHPSVQLPDPGACPSCGMDLIVARPAAASTDRVVLTERARALARLRTTLVRRQGDAAADLRLLGRVEPDETTRRNVTTWVGGRIDRLHVNVTGETVRPGQVVATLYSPEVYGAHQDLLAAKSQVARLSDSPESAQTAAVAALAAARERLRLLGVPEQELAAMETAERPTREVPIRTPFGGTVIERVATEGAYVDTGAPLYRIADLGRLWVQLDAYESDLPRLAVDQSVTLQVEALPGERFDGRVAFIDPTVDARRRTARVRVEVSNIDGRLRPGMFAEAVVATTESGDGGGPLVIPVSAPLFTGKRSVVYVEVEGSAYVPRTVRLGPRLGDVYPVVAGLAEGESVVSRGAFAIDADLQIRGGASMMTLPDDQSAGPWDGVVDVSAAQREALSPVVEGYLAVQVALADDALEPAAEAAASLVRSVEAVELTSEPWGPLATELATHARLVAAAVDLEGARAGFEPLSGAIRVVLQRFGNPTDDALHVAHCPMAMDDAGASWVQRGETIDNAYFGASMLRCGEVRHAVPPGGHLPATP